ncbi:hypothetical protein WJX74_007749 [Apatococcus lobatus]|uniref:Apple domain-containing protein n=1 Tax=Apatococcus lobatus TaxID=904363 RepID=A0AAW1RDV6_9CHLO
MMETAKEQKTTLPGMLRDWKDSSQQEAPVMRTRSVLKAKGGSGFFRPSFVLTAAITSALVTTILCIRYIKRAEVGYSSLQGGAVTRLLSEHLASSQEHCEALEHTEYWGDVVRWGDRFKKATAQECCQACRAHLPPKPEDRTCNVWVHCGDVAICGGYHQQCWLKHLPHADGIAPKAEGPHVPWTSGIVRPSVDDAAQVAAQAGHRAFHVVISASGPAVHWQSRVCHFQYKRVKAVCEAAGKCEMGGFTRLLHEGKADELMREIPTFVADPLPADQAPDDGFVVLNRPYAFLQWVQQTTIPERYVLMSEPDHLWIKPLSNIMLGERPIAFPFFYIEPWKDEFMPVTTKHLGPLSKRQAEEIAPIGNAPTLLSWRDLKKVCPQWLNTSLAIYNDKESRAAWGWVQEMYGFTLAAYAVGLGHVDLYRNLMSQPPWDSDAERFNILHYTYGMDYALNGTFTPGIMGEWRFDKRSYGQSPPPRNLAEPPVGMKNDLVRSLIAIINEATATIPGWDDYVISGRALQTWDGRLPS